MGQPCDKIILRGMQFYAFHGVNPEERAAGQTFLVDLEVQADLRPAGLSDRLEDTVNYSHLYRAVREVMEGPPRELLEALAEAIAQRVLATFPVVSARVRVEKTRPPIQGAVLQGAAVEILRTRPSP